MKTIGKIFLIAVLTLAAIGLGFLIDAQVFDRGEENQAPAVGIKAAAVEPKFVTADAQPIVGVFVKGEAARVWLEVAKRIEPTRGGETLAVYELSPGEIFPASRLNPEDTGSVQRWAAVLAVPEESGQYLLTAYAQDGEGRETKFKMFNSVLAVQPRRDQPAGDTPGQSTILKFLDFVSAGKTEEAEKLLTPGLRAKTVPLDLFAISGQTPAVSEVELIDLSLAGTETDRVLMTNGSGTAAEFLVELVFNQENPLAKWQITSVKNSQNYD